MHFRFFICSIVLLLTATTTLATDSRAAAPSPEQQIKLRTFVQQQFNDSYTGNEPADRIALAKLLGDASLQADTTDHQFALLTECRDAYARGGDLETGEKICQTIATKFDQTIATARTGMFKAAAEQIANPETFFPTLLKAADEALLADDFTPARQMLESGTNTAAMPQASNWRPAIQTRLARLDAQLRIYPAIKPALATLAKNPADPQSNLLVGEYACLVKSDWKSGLPLLSRGSDLVLRDLAIADLKQPEATDLQLDIADGWSAIVTKLPAYALPLQLHAYDWYIRALPNATIDTQRSHVEEQLATLIPLVSRDRDFAAIWVAVGDSLSHRAYTPSHMEGGLKAASPASRPFQDLPPRGALLVGFNIGFALQGGKQVITYFQPIYLTPTGEQVGTGCGRLFSKTKVFHAPQGYAIGAIYACGGAGLNSITPIYMQIEQDHLNPGNTRKSPRIGGSGGTLGVLDGRGTPVIGICSQQKDGFVGLGLIYSQPVKEDDASTQSR